MYSPIVRVGSSGAGNVIAPEIEWGTGGVPSASGTGTVEDKAKAKWNRGIIPVNRYRQSWRQNLGLYQILVNSYLAERFNGCACPTKKARIVLGSYSGFLENNLATGLGQAVITSARW